MWDFIAACVLMPLQNAKPAMETASQLKQPSAPQALVAIPSFILAVEEVNQQGSGTEAPQHGPRLTNLPKVATCSPLVG